jgi:monoamine oxidase
MKRSPGLSRRAFLKQAAVAAPAAALFPRFAAGQDPVAAAETAPAPEPLPPAAPQKVVVVGAGLAGLAAAWELTQLGHDVTLLEASRRPGGRIRTLREPFADGLYAEAGAFNHGERLRHYNRYVELFNLPLATSPRPPRPLAMVEFLNGQRIEVRPGQVPEWPIELTPEERSLGVGGLYRQHLLPFASEIGDPTDPSWRIDPFLPWDQMTLAELLKGRGLSEGAIRLLAVNMIGGYGWSEGSALHRLVSDLALFPTGARFLAGGADRLPDAFARALGERIWYGAPVIRIVQQPNRVRVVFRQIGEERTIEADRVVCTAPIPALRKIAFTPELPPAKRRIFSQLEYTPVTRVFVQMRRRSWAENGYSGLSGTELPIDLVGEHPPVRAENQTRGILECHIRGPEAARVGTLDADAQISWVVEHLEKLHPGIKQQVEGGTSVAWHEDPWIGGGYAWWKPGQLTGWLPELARPEGRIHFAGEHTSVLARTLEGAAESGNRAAREVHEISKRS